MKFYDPHFNEAGLLAFRRIQGEFHPSNVDRALQRMGALVLVALGVLLIGRLYRDYRIHGLIPSMWVLMVEAPGMIALGGYLWRRAGCWARFNVGQLQYLTASGKVLWEEELAGVTAVEKRSSRGGEYLVVRWERKRHSIALSDELSAALEAAMGVEQTRSQEEPDESDATAALPVWRCAKCGEENPGNFEACWKCEADRAGGGGPGSVDQP